MLDINLLDVHRDNPLVITICNVTQEYIFTLEELSSMVIALSVLGEILSDGLENFDPLDVLQLDTQEIETLLTSYVIWHFMAEMLTQVIDDLLDIPSAALEHGVITREEILNLINSLSLISELVDGVDLQNLESIMENPLFILELIDGYVMEETSLYTMLKSYVMWLTISNALLGLLPIEIPEDVIYTIQDDNFVTKSEIFNLVDALSILNEAMGDEELQLDNIENIFLDMTILEVISGNMGEEPTSSKLYQILNSLLIRAMVSDVIKQIVNAEGNILSIPVHVLENNFIQKEELVLFSRSLVNLLDSLEDAIELSSIIYLSYTSIVEGSPYVSDTMLYHIFKSVIMHYSISNILKDILTSEELPLLNHIPEEALENDLISRFELVTLMQSFTTLGIVNPANIVIGELMDALVESAGDQDTLAQDTALYNLLSSSKIMYAIISNFLEEIVIDLIGAEGLDSILVDGMIPREEIVYLLRAINLFVGDEINLVFEDINMFENLLNSRIIHLKISEIILNDILDGKLPNTIVGNGFINNEDLLEFISTLFVISGGNQIYLSDVSNLIEGALSLEIIEDIFLVENPQYILRSLLTTQLLIMDLPLFINMDDERTTYEIHFDLGHNQFMLISTDELLSLVRIISQLDIDLEDLIEINAMYLLQQIGDTNLEEMDVLLTSIIFVYLISDKILGDDNLVNDIESWVGEIETTYVDVWRNDQWERVEVISEEFLRGILHIINLLLGFL